MTTTKITLEELKPKFLDAPNRYNNWYNTADFTFNGVDYCLKLSLTEGTLLGQQNFMSLSSEPLKIVEENGIAVLKKPENDINLIFEGNDFHFDLDNESLTVEMGDMKVICKEDERRVICKSKELNIDIVSKPRGPIFYWGKKKGALCQVTEGTEVAGIESLSTINGSITTNKQKIDLKDARGLFERVWFGKLDFFQIRIMNWLYANFDQLYTYICHTESQKNDGGGFHFETGKIYLLETDDYLFADRFEIVPESWVYFEEAKRFIPWEQSVEVRTQKGRLKYTIKPYRYPQLIQPPIRMFDFVVDNIPGWSSLFYDLPVKLEGKFIFKDGEKLELTNGRGINELIRLVPL
ncbi:MAG: hypothetical protein DRP02_02095 [Candidatus Gerdarchaeota archaeon]|nr:MAG: hypothetical protein DRO63_00470 [Candidatus Gerdarchaeota archaeon]RLI72328.1 MAG: hypothetical protein DRP02_02095 [Candidatus Gerdarchaeota archaeon]